MIGIMVCSAALVIVLSVFNGMQGMISGWFNAFNPDLEITLAEGKSFAIDSFPKTTIAQFREVASVEEVVSDLVLTTYQGRQELLHIKGVAPHYIQQNSFEEMIIDGRSDLYRSSQPCAVIGSGAAGRLLIHLNGYDRLKLFYPKRTKKNFSQPADAFNTQYLYPSGVFCTNTNYDQNYIFCPINFARELMMYEGEVTSIEIRLKKGADLPSTQRKIEQLLGHTYNVQNKYQQEATLFKTMQSEKLVIYVILAFILFVAAFNIIGSIAMLILEKQRDALTLRSLGAPTTLIQRIFLYEGMLTSLLGGLGGMIVGAFICLLQQTFHIVKLGAEGSNYLISYYPVEMHGSDFLLVFFTIVTISLITALLPAARLKKTLSHHRL